MTPPASARLAAWWSQQAWLPHTTGWMRLLVPLSWLYAALLSLRARPAIAATAPAVVVVGNWVVGGAGKTPTVIALVQALAARGFAPGVVSRGYGRASETAALLVGPASTAHEVGDEPLLIHRRTGAPVCVARDRRAALHALHAAHPAVDVVVADDGLQHAALTRAAELWVFDDRGTGNGRLLPAGPLRAPLPAAVPPHARVLYTGQHASTALPGPVALRSLRHAVPLASWWSGDGSAGVPLAALPRDGLVAVAGIAAPEKFFSMLEQHGLRIARLPQPDHAAYASAPWPAGATDVLVTEKDAVKLPAALAGSTRVWVVPLDFELPVALVDDLVALLPDRTRSTPTP